MGWLVFIGMILALVFMPKNMLMSFLVIALIILAAVVAFVVFFPASIAVGALVVLLIFSVVISKLRKYVREGRK